MVSVSPLPPVVNRLAARALPVLPTVLTWLFALLTALLAAKLLWLLVPVPDNGRWRPAPITPPPQQSSSVSNDPVAEISAAALFGRYEAPDAAISPTALRGEAPDTRLPLTLLGILAAGDPSSRALIAAQGQPEEPYAVGEEVTRGARIRAIHPDRVILERAGALETLRLDKDRASSGVISSPAPARGGEEGEDAEGEADTAALLGNIRTELLQNPAKASDYLRVQPAMVSGEMRGYRIYPGRERSLFSKVGLRPGDLVTTINGVQLNDPARALQMLSDLSAANALTLVVERGGEQQTINLSLD